MRFASSMEPSVWRPAAVAFRERILGLVRGSINAKGQLTHDPVPRAAASVASRQVTRSHIAACVRAEPPDLQLHLPVLLRREANPAAVDAWAGHGVVDCVADSDRGCPLCHPCIYLSIYLSIYPSIYLSIPPSIYLGRAHTGSRAR